jgi:hypothetical protein
VLDATQSIALTPIPTLTPTLFVARRLAVYPPPPGALARQPLTLRLCRPARTSGQPMHTTQQQRAHALASARIELFKKRNKADSQWQVPQAPAASSQAFMLRRYVPEGTPGVQNVPGHITLGGMMNCNPDHGLGFFR